MDQTVSIGERLRAERLRLNMSQPAFGEIGCVTKKTQMLYENGDRFPDAKYLAAIAAVGVDVLYILTGQRGATTPLSTTLSPRASALLDNYEHTDEEGKRIIEGTARLAARPNQKKTGTEA